jgi:hypothetical protein
MRHFVPRVIACLGLTLCSISLCNGQQPPVLRLDRPIDLHLSKATLMRVLGMLSVEKNIPIGIEFSADEKNEPKLDIDVNKSPLVEVLNLIVQQEPRYVWELRDGVINFTPVQNRDPFFERLLDTSVRNFQSPKGNNKFAIREALLNLPEIEQVISANHVKADMMGYPHRPSIYTNQVDLSDKNTSFRSLLNRVIRESETQLLDPAMGR